MKLYCSPEKLDRKKDGNNSGRSSREKSVSQICREHGISQAQYYKWRDKFLEGVKEGLENGKKSRVQQLEKKIEELEKVIGKQTIVIETLKKL